MARRRHEKEEEEEKEVFTPPEFDEKEYIEEEMNKARASISIVVLGALFAVVSAVVFISTDSWAGSALIGLSGFFFFKFIYPLFKADPSLLRKKDYVAHGAIYLFSWLAVFILCVNMPFADLSAPEIENVHLEGFVQADDGWFAYNGTGNFSDYRIVATVTDNSGIDSVEIKYGNHTWMPMKSLENSTYIFNLSALPPRDTVFFVKAVDTNTHEATVSWTFR